MRVYKGDLGSVVLRYFPVEFEKINLCVACRVVI